MTHKEDLIGLLLEVNQIRGSHLESVIYQFKNLIENSALACCSEITHLRPGVWKIDIDKSTCGEATQGIWLHEATWIQLPS